MKQFKVEPQTDGSIVITLKPAFEHEVIRWILGEAGKIEVLNPPELRSKVAAAGKLIWERNQGMVVLTPQKKTKASNKNSELEAKQIKLDNL